MKKRTLQLLSALLAVCFLLSAAPLTGFIVLLPVPIAEAYAAGSGASYEETLTSGEIVASGTLEDGVTWTLDSNGVLIVSGSGVCSRSSRWASLPVKTVLINEGITSIGWAAFRDCTQLTYVSIPETVTSIEESAFADCSSLASVVLPESVIRLDGFAFCATAWYENQPDGMVYLGDIAYGYKGEMPENTEIVLREGTRVIAGNAFKDYTQLSSVTIPAGAVSIGSWAFYGCKGLTSVSIPESVSVIGFNAFYDCSALTSADLPAGLTVIETNTFYNCRRLASVTIPESVTHIEESAFTGCCKLASVTIPAGVTAIEPYAFYGCTGLQSITVAEENPNYRAEGNCLIDTAEKKLILGCNASVIPADGSVERIGEYAFFGDAGLEALHIPACVIEIDDSAFFLCTGLQSITVAEGNPNYHAEGNCLIDTAEKKLILGCNASEIPADGSVTTVGPNAFSGCSGFFSVIIPGSIISIKEGAFEECAGLENVVIKNGVTSIGDYAFSDCRALTSVSIPASVTDIGYAAIPEHTVIYGNAGSYAQTWAQNNGRVFLDLGETFVDLYAPAAVSDAVVDVWGYTNAGAAVVCSVNGVVVDTVTAAASGKWSTSLPLTGAQDGDLFGIAAAVTLNGETASESAEVTYLPEAVVFDSFSMVHGCYSVTVNGEDLGRRTRNITFIPGQPISVKVHVSNSDRVSRLWIESAKVGVIYRMPLQYSAQHDAWYACGFFEGAPADYIPGVITVRGEDKNGASFDTGAEIKINFLIDPSGYAYEAVRSNVLEGVTAAVYYKDAEGHEILWNADPAEQVNPITTLADGAFAWIVPEGTWQVRLYKEGYETAVSEWMDVPPEYTNLYIPMVTTAAPEVSALSMYEDHVEILFSNYMDIASVTTQTVVFNGYSGTVTPTDAEETFPGSNVFYAKSFRFEPDTVFTGDVSAVISGAANYAGVPMTGIYTQTVSFAQAPSDLTADEEITVACGSTARIAISAQNAAGAKVVVSSDSAIISPDSDALVLDDTGSAVLSVQVLMPGTATVTFSLEGTLLNAYTAVTAELPATHTEHIWNAGEIIEEATCRQSGVRLYTCTVAGCDAAYEEVIDPDPDHHVNTEEVAETASTCYKAGYTAGVYCNDCRQFISGHEVKPQPAHVWDEGAVTLKPTCKTTGTMLYRCTVKSCGAVKEETIQVDPNAHVYNVTVAEPTCTEAGYTTHVCTLCSYEYTDNETGPLGHSYAIRVTSATCTSGGCTTCTCTRCHDSYTKDPTPPVDHVDADGDGKCDFGCGTVMSNPDGGGNEGDKCPFCGQTHTGPFGSFIAFFHRIAYFFKHLFRR